MVFYAYGRLLRWNYVENERSVSNVNKHALSAQCLKNDKAKRTLFFQNRSNRNIQSDNMLKKLS